MSLKNCAAYFIAIFTDFEQIMNEIRGVSNSYMMNHQFKLVLCLLYLNLGWEPLKLHQMLLYSYEVLSLLALNRYSRARFNSSSLFIIEHWRDLILAFLYRLIINLLIS